MEKKKKMLNSGFPMRYIARHHLVLPFGLRYQLTKCKMMNIS